jgi:hypothetical protein
VKLSVVVVVLVGSSCGFSDDSQIVGVGIGK